MSNIRTSTRLKAGLLATAALMLLTGCAQPTAPVATFTEKETLPTTSVTAPAAPAHKATVISEIWVDDTWAIEDAGSAAGAACDDPWQAYNARGRGFFSCGAMAAGLFNCMLESESGVALCPESYSSKTARRVTTAFSANEIASLENPNPDPFAVILEDGTVCEPISHDQEPHFEGRLSWLRCDGGDRQALLVKEEEPRNYFRVDGEVYYADLAEGEDAPVEVAVAEIVFLGLGQ